MYERGHAPCRSYLQSGLRMEELSVDEVISNVITDNIVIRIGDVFIT